MNLRAQREKANAAAGKLMLRQRCYRRSKNDLAADIAAWQPVLLVGGGLVAGSLLARLRMTCIARAVAATASFTTMIARSSVGSIALAALLRRARITDETTSGRVSADHGSKPLA